VSRIAAASVDNNNKLLKSLLEKQNNRCNICLTPRKRFDHFVVDYCRTNKKPLGAICNCCAYLLVHASSDAVTLRRAAWHLEQLSGNYKG